MNGMRNLVLILGGGINGAALARELSLNGVPWLLVDRGDIASGATAYSTRLIHGGLRYLEYGEFSLVRESLEERNRLLTLASDFVKPLRLYIPVRQRTGGLWNSLTKFLHLGNWSRASDSSRGLWLIRAGLAFYDRFASGSLLPRHSVYPSRAAGNPQVDPVQFPWLASYHDAQIAWPERFVVALLRDAQQVAQERGTTGEILTYHQATRVGDAIHVQPNSSPPGEALRVRPAVVINATGAWVDTTLQSLQVASRRLMGGTQGSHLITYHAELRASLGDGGLYGEARDGRPVFILPFGPAVLIGTTDLPFSGDPADARAANDEVSYLLDAIQSLLPQICLKRSDITMTYSGVRPLPHSGTGSTAAITRRHWLEPVGEAPFPIYSVIGGKLTTCRSLAEQTADVVLKHLSVPRIADTRDRSLSESPAASSLLDLDTTSFPEASLIEKVAREEWITRLEDLVERRLMLHFRRQLDQSHLERLADIMVSMGKLPSTQLAAAVARCRERLETHYGRQVSTGPSNELP